jgi:hypothetical protein
MLCGNKTDQCPNCQKFIRRAIFAYHYENNCANLDEPDAPAQPTRISSAHRPSSSNTSKPTSKTNDFIDNDQENKSDSSFINDPSDKSYRISSATSKNSTYLLYSVSNTILFLFSKKTQMILKNVDIVIQVAYAVIMTLIKYTLQ